VVGFGEEISEEKTYFDLADLICVVSGYINLHHGLGQIEKEESKDRLENQIIRGIGDLLYSELDDKMGRFLQHLRGKYLDQISQFKKTDLLKIPHLKDFGKEVRDFFNTSALTQLQNQNNPLAEVSYNRKLSVLGAGGFSSANTTLTTRNINPSFYGRYDLVETPEGQRVGLVHNLTMGAKINSYGQIVAPYYSVKEGVVSPGLVYLKSEEEKNKYIAHCKIAIDEKNRILATRVLARYQEDFV
jgi:DNA-directed RNA polymerase subunit beta